MHKIFLTIMAILVMAASPAFAATETGFVAKLARPEIWLGLVGIASMALAMLLIKRAGLATTAFAFAFVAATTTTAVAAFAATTVATVGFATTTTACAVVVVAAAFAVAAVDTNPGIRESEVIKKAKNFFWAGAIAYEVLMAIYLFLVW